MPTTTQNTPNNVSNSTVQQRLLDAAEQLFSDNGFAGTSVRDLAAAAKCNIASVNYYFGGKERLYFEVFNRRMVILRDVRLSSINKVMAPDRSTITIEVLLRAFANAFIEPLVDESGGRRFITLMTREMLDPRLPEGMFLGKTVIPVTNALQAALLEICPKLDKEKAIMAIHSIVAQLIHLIRVQEMFGQSESEEFPLSDFGRAVDHIVEFSAAGIRAAAEKK